MPANANGFMETAGGRRIVQVEGLIAALRTQRPNREDSADAADIIEQLIAAQVQERRPLTEEEVISMAREAGCVILDVPGMGPVMRYNDARVTNLVWRLTSIVSHAFCAALSSEQTPAARDVLAERRRQIEAEGWTAEHDDTEHDGGDLAAAAASYALAAADALNPLSQGDGSYDTEPPAMWPWAEEWWKPGAPRRMLVKACALGLAAIEQRDRETARAAVSRGETESEGGEA